jgi:hypothetical protein
MSKKKTLSRTAKKRRLAKRKSITHLVDTLRDADDGPSLLDIGAELRGVVTRLKRMEAYLIIAGTTLDHSVSYSGYVAVLLQHGIGDDLLFKTIRALENLAAKCDGGESSDRNDDEDESGDADVEEDL